MDRNKWSRSSECASLRHGVALLRGISTPSLAAQGGQRLPSYFNIDRDIPQSPIFQSFISGGSLVDIADRDAPLSSDGNALVLAVDTNILNDRFRETLISAATAKFFKRYAAAISTAYAPLGM